MLTSTHPSVGRPATSSSSVTVTVNSVGCGNCAPPPRCTGTRCVPTSLKRAVCLYGRAPFERGHTKHDVFGNSCKKSRGNDFPW
eukprot:783405-Rhodomonas_salina.1